MLRALTFLGTSSGVPTPARNVSGMVVALVGGEQWLFDCGEGTQHQLQRCKDASAGKLRRIFVTHMHGDHCYGLPGLICSMGMAGALGCRDAAPGDAPPVLELIGPVHLAAWLRTTLLVTSGGLPFRYRVTELLPAFDAAKAQADAIAATSAAVAAPAGDDADAEAGAQAAGHPMLPPVAPALDPAQLHPCEDPPVFLRPDSRGVYELGRLDGVSVQAAQLVHPVPCFGYAIAEDEAPGTLDAAAVAAAGVPKGPLFGQLKAGRPVTLPCGKVVLPGDVTGPPKPGRVLTVLGDTCDSTAMAATRAQGGSWMTHEATFDDATGPLAVARGHSTARMAGACARQLGVTERLILTHFSARFPPRDRDPGPVDGMLRQARAGAVAGAVAVGGDAAEEERLAEQCPIAVSAAEDFATFDLTRKKL